MTPEQIAAIAGVIAALMGLGGCCAAILTPLGVVVGVLGKQWLDARKSNSDIHTSEVKLLRDNIEEIRKRYQEEIEVTRKRCADDRLTDRLEVNTWRDEANRLEKENTELLNKFNDQRKENIRIRALAYKQGFTIPDEQRKDDFTNPVIDTDKE